MEDSKTAKILSTANVLHMQKLLLRVFPGLNFGKKG